MPGNKILELRGTTLPSSITFNESFKMEFISDAITVSRGFSLTYSIGKTHARTHCCCHCLGIDDNDV